MKLTTKGRYAVMAMADLAMFKDKGPISLADISIRQNISLAYLEQIFIKLKQVNLVKSVRGAKGGYVLDISPEEIKISNIISAVDEEIKTLNCKKESKKGCNNKSSKCITHNLWDQLDQHINSFFENGFSVIKVNFRGVGKSDGIFDNGQGELSDAAAALDWIERQNLDYSQCWVSGFSFGSLICMQLIMRRPEVNNFIAVSPQPNVYDFSFLAPCPTSGQVIYSDNDELVTQESINELDQRIKSQKGVDVIFSKIKSANHFFKNKEKELSNEIEEYLKDKTALI